MKHVILLAHNQIAVDSVASSGSAAASPEQLGTVLTNMAHFGFCPSLEVVSALQALTASQLATWWKDAVPAFKSVTGADREMARFVVYKNFPKEVLAMDQAQYWFNQILMYLGAPNDWFTQESAQRPALDERLDLKVLRLAEADALESIAQSLTRATSRWAEPQTQYIDWLAAELRPCVLRLADFGFKENGLALMARVYAKLDCELSITDATDVLRLAAALSDADISLREKVTFRRFSRAERRQLVQLLDATKNLAGDFASRPALWKKLLSRLHPGDFNAPRVQAAYDALYKGEVATFNTGVEAKLCQDDASVLSDLAKRPGEFARRLHGLWARFGMAAVDAFVPCLPALDNTQLLKLRGYLRTINGRAQLVYAPRGNWSKAQFVENRKVPFSAEALRAVLMAADGVLASRLYSVFPQGANVDLDVAQVKLPTNDQELAAYGRGTVFPIPEHMQFIRSASYWACKRDHHVWFDNGWNFFDTHWQPIGSCCWDATHEMGDAAVFSGDPSNGKDLKGRACQMIDLYLDKLAQQGVRYAVWNILAYSHLPFAQAEDVLATLQWGEGAEKGKLYEPARAQMVFPLKGNSLTKYVAYVDVAERKLVYLDANLAGNVSSARRNAGRLAHTMPGFLEYLKSLPSVADLFEVVLADSTEAVPVLYSDADIALTPGQPAYVFRPLNPANQYAPIDLRAVA